MRLVITGSSGGIGQALAHHLLGRGHQVWGIARSEPSGFPAGPGIAFRSSRADVSQWSQVEAAAQTVAGAWHSIDGLICCAGIQGAIGPALTADPAQWSETVRVNLDGTYYCIRAFAPLFAQSARRAKIVCFSGGGATKARPHFSAYGVSKTAVVRLVETLAEEMRATPVDINAVAPGAIATRLTDEVIARGPALAGQEEYRAAVATKNAGDAPLAKAIGLVEWLLSAASDGISGRLISAPWDPWPTLGARQNDLAHSDIYTLRRITPSDRGQTWNT